MSIIKDTIKNHLLQVIEAEYGQQPNFQLEYPREEKFGDYATNVAMTLAKELKKNPLDIARKLITLLRADKDWDNLMEKEEIAGPGFINFYLKETVLKLSMEKILSGEDQKALSQLWKGKRYLLEHTSANPVHTVHIGHLLNNFIGMAVARLIRTLGAEVEIDYIDNDRGTGVTRAMIGYLAFADKGLAVDENNYCDNLKGLKLGNEEVDKIIKNFQWRDKLKAWRKNSEGWFKPEDLGVKSDYFDLCVYSPGARAAKSSEKINKQVQEMLVAWEDEDKTVRDLWQLIVNWSMEGYKKTLDRLGSETNYIWHESEIYRQGKEWVKKGLEQGIFKKLDDGAVISQLEKYGLPDLILQKATGAALYPTQDLELTSLKVKQYPDRDQYIWCVGKDQDLYLQQIFEIVDQLGIIKREKLFHLNYGFIRLKTGKMKSSLGNVVNADEFMDKMKVMALKIIEGAGVARQQGEAEKEKTAEQVMLAALKYGLLKYTRQRDFEFDVDESLSLEGNSGPYIQYTYARTISIINKTGLKFKDDAVSFAVDNIKLTQTERFLFLMLSRGGEFLIEAAKKREPQIICDYLYRLAKIFNSFYEKERILGSGEEEPKRLALTRTVAKVLKFNLSILGIKAMERM